MNANLCSNHVLFEHGFELENTSNKPQLTCMTLYTERIVDQTDHFADAFVSGNVTLSYDIVMTI